MLKDSKITKYSELENGDSFVNYCGEVMMVHNITKTKAGRIRFYYTTQTNTNPIPYTHKPVKDKIISA